MRVTSPCQATMREIVEIGSLRSKAAVHHLRSCGHCREQLASFAHGWSQLGTQANSESDNQFSDQILSRIDHRARRRRLLRGAAYTLASVLAFAVAYYYAGSAVYNSALVPAWNFLIGSMAQLPSMAESLWSKVHVVFSGPVVLSLGAVVAFMWFSMLDRVAGYLRLHRA